MTAYDCAKQGHVWAEGTPVCGPDNTLRHQLFVRHSGRPDGKVSVYCIHCGDRTSLKTKGRATVHPAQPPVAVTRSPHG